MLPLQKNVPTLKPSWVKVKSTIIFKMSGGASILDDIQISCVGVGVFGCVPLCVCCGWKVRFELPIARYF